MCAVSLAKVRDSSPWRVSDWDKRGRNQAGQRPWHGSGNHAARFPEWRGHRFGFASWRGGWPEDLLAASVRDDFAPGKTANYYPPALMGMRGNHEGTYTFAHRLRDGESPDSFGAVEATVAVTREAMKNSRGCRGPASYNSFRAAASRCWRT